MVPETRYASSGGINIAYQVIGDGPIDLVIVPGWVSNIEAFWEEPNYARFFRELASFSRLILFDKRGTGLSDRVVEVSTLEERMDDVRAVMEAIGSTRAALLGYSEGGPHTGECEMRDDSITGLSLHIAARVAALASPGNIVVSRTVKDLVAGSGISFEDFGMFDLKGVPDQWRLYRVLSPGPV